MERCPARPWPAQDALQPLQPLEPARRIRPHLRDACWRRAKAKMHHDRCHPSEGAPPKSRKIPLPYDKALYKQRHKVENMLAKLKDWRRIATRYDRCAHTFFSAICIAATVAFYLNQ